MKVWPARLSKDGQRVLCGWRSASGRHGCNGEIAWIAPAGPPEDVPAGPPQDVPAGPPAELPVEIPAGPPADVPGGRP
jgi:hypothetical protein